MISVYLFGETLLSLGLEYFSECPLHINKKLKEKNPNHPVRCILFLSGKLAVLEGVNAEGWGRVP